MKKNYSIAASCVTVGELRKLLEDLPQDYKVTFCGEAEGFINVLGADGYITLDHTNDYMEEYTDGEPVEIAVKDGTKLIGTVYYDDAADWCYFCEDDRHEEQGFKSAEKAEDALREYFYNK